MPRHRSAKSIMDLPQKNENWFVLLHQFSKRVKIEESGLIKPWIILVVIAETGMLYQFELMENRPDDTVLSQLLFRAIKEASQVMPSKPHRPTAIVIEDETLAQTLAPEFADFGIAVDYAPRPEGAEELISGMEAAIGGSFMPGLLSVSGVTPQIAGAFFDAAATFYEAAPWEALTNAESLKIEISGDKRTRFVSIMGDGGIEYGLAIYENWKDYLRMIEFADDPMKAISPTGSQALYFNEDMETPEADLDAAEQYGWRVVDDFYPVPVIAKLDEESFIRPPLQDILWYEAVLRAIPIFAEEFVDYNDDDEMLPAKAKISVETTTGTKEVHITYPAGKIPDRLLQKMNMPALSDDDMVDFRRAMEGMLSQIGVSLGAESELSSDVNQAQEIMYDAWEERTPSKRIAKAKQALKISADCADAYVLLAQEAAKSKAEALQYFEQGMAAGERALGKQFFRQNAGHFWGLIETRPYMRAREGVANLLWTMGRTDEAVSHFQEMLTLNPNDNQGIRYSLLNLLITTNQNEAANKLIKQFKEDGMAEWGYGKALLAFRKEGDSTNSKKLLRAAIKQNPHVPAFLTGKKRLPAQQPQFIGYGDEDEAASYAGNHLQNWRNTPSALEWLTANTK